MAPLPLYHYYYHYHHHTTTIVVVVVVVVKCYTKISGKSMGLCVVVVLWTAQTHLGSDIQGPLSPSGAITLTKYFYFVKVFYVNCTNIV
jgi:hypothetical protein